jgi:hypothetical protein
MPFYFRFPEIGFVYRGSSFLSRIARNRASRAPTFGFAANIGAVEILQANMHGAPLQSCSAGKVPSRGMRHIVVPRGSTLALRDSKHYPFTLPLVSVRNTVTIK